MVSLQEPFRNQSNQEHSREAYTVTPTMGTDGFGVTKMGQVEVRPWNRASNAQIWPRYPPRFVPVGLPQSVIKMVEMGTGETA